jgi:hypothetical protein
MVFPNRNAFSLLYAECAGELRLQFLRDPSAELDIQGCIDSDPPIDFRGPEAAQ